MLSYNSSMLQIKNLNINLAQGKEIVKNFNLTVNPGEIHLLNGKNGSGKSTLVNTLMGNPSFEIIIGEILLKDENIPEYILEKIDNEFVTKNEKEITINLTHLEPTERSLCGLFLANQYPIEIPGVSLTSFLRLIYNARRPKEEQLPVFKFKNLLLEKAKLINYPEHLLKRNLNEGFSGGEKKKTEILQMLVLEPKYVFLDENDSGLDKSYVQEVFTGISEYKKLFPQTAFIIITHYDRVKEFLKIDFEHEMQNGELIA